MSLTKVTYSMIDGPALNIKDYGAVGNGIANDTAAFLAFKNACVAQGAKGVIPAGVYLIDSFILDYNDSGLVLEGPTFNSASASPGIAGPGYFGTPIAVLRLRSASASFVEFKGVYNLQISNLAFDGNQFADNVFHFDGTVNNTELEFNNCEFYGATPTTGIVHNYTGSIGGDHCYFNKCFIYQYHNYSSGPNRAAFCLKNSNTNAFRINYNQCFFAQADILIQYSQGACNLYDCTFFQVGTVILEILSVTQPFVILQPYTEQTDNKIFIRQVYTAGVTVNAPITLINPQINSNNTGIVLTCQQPFNIYGGFIGGNIEVNPVLTYGTARHIFDSVSFNSGYGVIGTGAVTQSTIRNSSVNNVYSPNRSYGSLDLLGLNDSNNEGSTISTTNKTWINVANTLAQNVTGLTGGLVGQEVLLYFMDGNTTLVNGTNFKLQGSTNVTPTANSAIKFIGSGAAPGLAPIYWSEISRSIK